MQDGKRHYAYKLMLPVLWQAFFYLLIAGGAAFLVRGSTSWADKGLCAVLILGSLGYAVVAIRRFCSTYYRLDKDAVVFYEEGQATDYPYDALDGVLYDSAHAMVQLVCRSGYAKTYGDYSDLSPLITLLDERGIRIEYKRMDS